MRSLNKFFLYILIFNNLIIGSLYASTTQDDFKSWLSSYKKFALKKGISQETIDLVFTDVRFLENVIKYDRKQPEFYEDTITYVSKRANTFRAEKAKSL